MNLKKRIKIKKKYCLEFVGNLWDGKNCCECEKCWRTILGIIAEKGEPCEFGFNLTVERREEISKKLYGYMKYNFRYRDIQKRFLDNYILEETPKDLLWIRDIKIKDKKAKHLIIYEKVINKIRNIIKKIQKK